MEDATALVATLQLALCQCDPTCQARTQLDELPLCHALIRLLASGQPVPKSTLADLTGLPLERLDPILAHMDLDYDCDGHVIGAGLTLRPTPHRFRLAGRELFTWCALDALMYPALLAETVQIVSPCRVTGQTVSARVTSAGVTDIDPTEAVVSLVRPPPGQPPRQAFCGEVHFFVSAAAALPWLAGRPNAVVVPVTTAFQVGRQLIELRAAKGRASFRRTPGEPC